ncbi:MAG: hypothetical protein RL095_776 [Verrucomicrobiota bacterium]|jgi:1,4-dihydroxy-6-naphthoate synthase
MLRLAFSPCPNDTYMFYGLLQDPEWRDRLAPSLADIAELNRLAASGEVEIAKVSCAEALRLEATHEILAAGAALGRGCGPLLVARRQHSADELAEGEILVPGFSTTAFVLLQGFLGLQFRPREKLFSAIMPALAAGEAEAGLIIHESRFTYRQHGLLLVRDLGEWWEAETGLPIPLGCIVARRDLPVSLRREFSAALGRSVALARSRPWREQPELAAFIRRHAQELSDEVLDQHIHTYVSAESVELSDEGRKALERLRRMLTGRGNESAALAPDTPALSLAGHNPQENPHEPQS